jgi:hypothetical protein
MGRYVAPSLYSKTFEATSLVQIYFLIFTALTSPNVFSRSLFSIFFWFSNPPQAFRIAIIGLIINLQIRAPPNQVVMSPRKSRSQLTGTGASPSPRKKINLVSYPRLHLGYQAC